MKILSIVLFAITIYGCGQADGKAAASPKDSASATPAGEHSLSVKKPYTFDTPRGWTTETIPFPIDFAPGIPFKGEEELRFPMGWGIPGNDEHWSYMFLWWVEGEQPVDEKKLQQYFTEYYNGLVGRNISERKIPREKQVETRVMITKTPTTPGDRETYSGKINMLNYMISAPIELNVKVHVRGCKEQNHTAIFTEISPQPDTHRIWKEYEKLVSDFSCKTN